LTRKQEPKLGSKPKAYEEAIEGMDDELTSTDKEFEAFLYSISHDLRSPITRIKGFTGILLNEYQEALGNEGADYLRRTIAAADHMELMIDSLLQLSRLSRTEMKREKVDLSVLARTIANKLRVSDPDRKNVKFRIAGGLNAYGDPDLLKIALENLLANSWKFTSKRPKALIEFDSKDVNGERVFFVKDNGAGFKAGHDENIFTPFRRFHPQSEFPGIGIGLSTVYRIVNRHGGKVWGEGQVGKGATFYFKIPDHSETEAHLN